ncbi:MAG: reverse transcriptase/maturase family protein [Patescibacteria group bacterium]|jgi:hypothetical protein
MFEKIIAKSNLETAYLRLAEQMEEDGRSGRYCGWDSLKLNDLEIFSTKVLKEARQEMIDFKPIAPAILVRIPKKNKPQKTREIHIYNLKDRIKAQAIYQIIEPSIDAYLSPWLFSYRVSHPSYFAARSTVRHYKRYFKRDFVLVADVADYFNHIDVDILLRKLIPLNFSEPVLKLITLFITNQKIQDGRIIKPAKGLIAGTPLLPMLANLYLDDLDKYCGPRVDFYRRVGDDFILFDQREERLQSVYDYLLEEVKCLRLEMNIQKTKYISAQEPFNYLGYTFVNGSIRLGQSFVRYTLKRWRAQFSFNSSRSEYYKINKLRKGLKRPETNLNNDFFQLAEEKKLVTDTAQVRRFSEAFFRILTRYFFGVYSPKNRRLLKNKLKGMKLTSIYKYFLNSQYGPGKRAN